MATDCLTAVVASGGLLVVAAAAAIEVQKKRKKRKIWTKQWILRRPVAGAFSGLIKDLFTTDEISYKNFLRMDAGAVEELFSRIEVKLTKQSTCLRKAISAKERMCVVLRFLATGKVRSRCLLKYYRCNL